MMRNAWIALALLVAACDRPAADAPEPSPSRAPTASSPAAALVGVWSFDRSCASGDGMRLNADNSATFDEWGQGTWALDGDTRLVLDLAVSEPGLDETGRRETVVINLAEAPDQDLNGELLGSPPRALNARRCP